MRKAQSKASEKAQRTWVNLGVVVSQAAAGSSILPPTSIYFYFQNSNEMNELRAIVEDVCTGALPVSEIPDFLAWSFRKVAWASLALLAGFGLAYVVFGVG